MTPQDVQDILNEPSRMMAVKKLRNHTNWGLREAVEFLKQPRENVERGLMILARPNTKFCPMCSGSGRIQA